MSWIRFGLMILTMDIPLRSAYLRSMIARFLAMLAIFAITVAAAATSAHAARMSVHSAPEHAAHAGEMAHSPDLARHACDGEQHCGSSAEMCDFVCAGLGAFLTSPQADERRAYGAANLDLPPESSHTGHAPGLNERPPKLRLL